MTTAWRTVLQMRITLYKRQFTGGRAIVKSVFGIFGLAAALGVCALAASGGLSQALVGGLTGVTLTLVGTSWVLLPVLSGISDDNIHPRHFQLLSVNPRSLARAMLTTSAVGIVVPITVVVTACIPIYAVSRSISALPLALIAWPATALFFVTLSRVSTLAMSQLLKSRRSRELALLIFGGIGGGLYFLQFPITNNLDQLGSDGLTWPLTLAHAVPFGWGITSVDAAIDNNWLVAVGTVAGLLIIDFALVWAWQRLVLRHFDGRVSATAGSSKKQLAAEGADSSRGWRATRVGAVVTRELSLWRGDVRRRSQLLSVVIFTVLAGIGPLVSESIPFNAQWGAWIVVLMALIAGSNFYGLDGSSMWHLVMIPEALRDDVRGRQIAWLLVATPFAVLATAVVRVFGDLGADRLEIPIAVTIALLGVGAGSVVVISTRAPFPVPEATKTFSMNTRGSFNGSALGLIFLSMLVLVLAVLPSLLLALLLPGPLVYLSIPMALATGWFGMWLGARMAVDTLTENSDKILTEVMSQ